MKRTNYNVQCWQPAWVQRTTRKNPENTTTKLIRSISLKRRKFSWRDPAVGSSGLGDSSRIRRVVGSRPSSPEKWVGPNYTLLGLATSVVKGQKYPPVSRLSGAHLGLHVLQQLIFLILGFFCLLTMIPSYPKPFDNWALRL